MYKKIFSSAGIAARIWILTCLVFGAGWLIVNLFIGDRSELPWWTCLIAMLCSIIGSIPSLVVLSIVMPWIERQEIHQTRKIQKLVITCLIVTVVYGCIAGVVIAAFWTYCNDGLFNFLLSAFCSFAALFACCAVALALTLSRLRAYFSSYPFQHSLNQYKNMETTKHPDTPWDNDPKHSKSNRIIMKAAITGALILLMMIPTVFITNLVSERKTRQEQVAMEVSSKWATAQTLTGPYLYVPYKSYYKDQDGKVQEEDKHFWILPDNLTVKGNVEHEIRPRSIYKVLLYRTSLQDSGNFVLRFPKDVDAGTVQWSDIRICYGLSDFKGIEERLVIKFNNAEYELSPGLPSDDIDTLGLSAPLNITAADLEKPVSFDSHIKLKGSGQLHFVPLAGNSSFALTSAWSNPSFDGNNLPTERKVGPAGFNARWAFSKANLPFGTMLKDFKFNKEAIAFGVTILEPADQYAKTSRCIKYAILFIGLTFSLFFIVELMQKKPVHPVQYVLIGLALVIFYTLLLSISEFMLFDYAYLIAAAGTILLITLYARGHFNSWKSAGIFGGVLTVLYGFIFILIRLEDTALLVGSIGLFIVLALVMYTSRKINWYGTTVPSPAPVSET